MNLAGLTCDQRLERPRSSGIGSLFARDGRLHAADEGRTGRVRAYASPLEPELTKARCCASRYSRLATSRVVRASSMQLTSAVVASRVAMRRRCTAIDA